MNALFFAVLCLIWGSTWMAIKINLSSFPPFYSAGLRFLLAGFILFAVMKAKRTGFPGIKRCYPSMVFGVLNGVSYGLVYWGEQFIPSGLTAILNASLPFFSVFFAYFFIREQLTWRKVAGLLVGFAGILLLFFDTLSEYSTVKLAGQLAVVTASAIYALAGVHIKKHSAIEPLPAVTIQMFSSSVVLLAVAVPADYNRAVVFSWPGLAAFLYLSILGSALAFYLYNWLILRMEVSKLGYISMITPAVATVLGAVWMGEDVGWRVLTGMGMILMGTAFINLKFPRKAGSQELH